MSCVAAILARNEADRYLSLCLKALQPLCDTILLLDDGSTDGTREMAEAYGAQVRVRGGDPMWGQESAARAELWAWAAEVAGDDWVLIADADQELNVSQPAWRSMMKSREATCWGIPLYDLWDSPVQFRSDGHWAAYKVKRPWMFRPSVCPDPVWNGRGIHCGHAPSNFPFVMGLAPDEVYWKHYGWMKREDREAKVDRYLETADQLSPMEIEHLLSAKE